MIKNLKKEKQVKKAKTSNKGITLIALVITIIVLLILAGVSVVTLTGDNGLLQKVNDAKIKSEEAEARERIQLEMLASVNNEGNYNKDKAKENLEKHLGLTVENGDVEENGDELKVKLNGYEFPVNSKGNVGNGTKIDTPTVSSTTVAEAKTAGTIFNKETTIVDSYKNKVVIPEGFKIASDSATEVAQGVVIEDARYTNTIGSQFVWIPVGTITGKVNGVEKTETIKLSRYTFDENGKETDQGSKAIEPEWTTDYDFQELSQSNLGNAVAKDIEAFKSSANNNSGYYLGRYEAGLTGDYEFDEDDSRTWVGTNMNMVCKPGTQVYNYVTQPKASELSRNMYADKNFTSDLINSYAWDTAIVFIQKFGEESNSSIYSRTAGLSAINTSEPQATGTNTLNQTGKIDKQCNIFDMAGNTFEWSTETSSNSYGPCVSRGSSYNTGGSYSYTSYRNFNISTSSSENNNAFRPLLYL